MTIKILLGITGSVAAIKTFELTNSLAKLGTVKIVYTQSSKQFFNKDDLQDFDVYGYGDEDENEDENDNKKWQKIGDPILHIELRKWADVLIIAPLTANTMAKIVNGLCDNLLTNIVRAWDFNKPFIVAPAMNTYMWNNPITRKHVCLLKKLGIEVIDPVKKKLACGDYGMGAMCSIDDIITTLKNLIKY